MDDDTWRHLWTPVSQDGMCGWVSTIGEAEAVRRAFEIKKSITYVSGKKESTFGKIDIGRKAYNHRSDFCLFNNMIVFQGYYHVNGKDIYTTILYFARMSSI